MSARNQSSILWKSNKHSGLLGHFPDAGHFLIKNREKGEEKEGTWNKEEGG